MLPTLLLLSLLPPPAPLVFWGRLGHRVVARIAEARLNPAAREEATLLLGGTLADASTWADSIRPSRPSTAPWHFVNIPLTADEYQMSRDCPGGQCIVEAIRTVRGVLADRTKPEAERAEALRFLIHFVGDLHQPLHAVGQDRGGNEVQGRFLGHPASLHQVWDSGILEAGNLSEDVWVGRLLARLQASPGVAAGLAAGTVEDWTRESMLRAREQVFGKLPPGGNWDETYVASRASIVEDALLAGGVRLARLLNEDLGTAP